jgi:transposase
MTKHDIAAKYATSCAQAKALHSSGTKVKEIAQQMGVSVYSVYDYLKRQDKPEQKKAPKPKGYARERCVEFLGFAVSWYRERMIAG